MKAFADFAVAIFFLVVSVIAIGLAYQYFAGTSSGTPKPGLTANCGLPEYVGPAPQQGRGWYRFRGERYNMTPRESPGDLLCADGQKAYWKRS